MSRSMNGKLVLRYIIKENISENNYNIVFQEHRVTKKSVRKVNKKLESHPDCLPAWINRSALPEVQLLRQVNLFPTALPLWWSCDAGCLCNMLKFLRLGFSCFARVCYFPYISRVLRGRRSTLHVIPGVGWFS